MFAAAAFAAAALTAAAFQAASRYIDRRATPAKDSGVHGMPMIAWASPTIPAMGGLNSDAVMITPSKILFMIWLLYFFYRLQTI
jgi:hypothetical protein